MGINFRVEKFDECVQIESITVSLPAKRGRWQFHQLVAHSQILVTDILNRHLSNLSYLINNLERHNSK